MMDPLKEFFNRAQRIREVLPVCRKCGCKWPAKDLRDSVCPNCREDKSECCAVGEKAR